MVSMMELVITGPPTVIYDATDYASSGSHYLTNDDGSKAGTRTYGPI